MNVYKSEMQFVFKKVLKSLLRQKAFDPLFAALCIQTSTVEPIEITQSSHPRKFVHLCVMSAHNSCLIIGNSTSYKIDLNFTANFFWGGPLTYNNDTFLTVYHA